MSDKFIGRPQPVPFRVDMDGVRAMVERLEPWQQSIVSAVVATRGALRTAQAREERDVAAGGPRTLWGVPVVENDLVPPGTALLIGPPGGAVRWFRFDPADDDPATMLTRTRRQVIAERIYRRGMPMRFEFDPMGYDYLSFIAEQRVALTLYRGRERWSPARQRAARTEYRRKTRRRNRRQR